MNYGHASIPKDRSFGIVSDFISSVLGLLAQDFGVIGVHAASGGRVAIHEVLDGTLEDGAAAAGRKTSRVLLLLLLLLRRESPLLLPPLPAPAS